MIGRSVDLVTLGWNRRRGPRRLHGRQDARWRYGRRDVHRQRGRHDAQGTRGRSIELKCELLCWQGGAVSETSRTLGARASHCQVADTLDRAARHAHIGTVSCVIHVHYYAAARELAGVSDETITLGSETPTRSDVLRWIVEAHPAFARVIDRMAIAVNDELSPVSDRLHDGDQVSVLPPVAGGSGSITTADAVSAISDQPLSLDHALRCVQRPGAGGVCMFIGVVRDHADNQPVARLDYEAHVTLARKEMDRILQALMARDPKLRLCALHRVGQLAVGDLAVIVAASAPHRAEAFAACREAIDQIKQTVPIWKKEWAENGEAHWVNL